MGKSIMTKQIFTWLKGALKSWTMRFNTLLALAGMALSDPTFITGLQEFAPQLKGHMPDRVYFWLLTGIGFIGMWLRTRTSTSLREKIASTTVDESTK